MHTVALRFLAEQAYRAAELGCTTELLFGVDVNMGNARVDACGALMISGGRPVVAVERDRIRFEANSYCRTPHSSPSIPVWDWREPKRQTEPR